MKKQSLKIEQIMTAHVDMVSPQTTVKDAARMMKDRDIGAVPVQDGDSLKGILTDRDITLRMVAEGRDCNSTKVGDIMSPGAVTCSPRDDVEDVEKTMEREKIRRIVVVNQNGMPVGVVSLGDIAVHLGEKPAGEVLGKVSEPVHSAGR